MKFRKGTASFYIVVASVLLFGVIIISFAHLISSESEKTTDDILAQSAYDAALAGIEDAKIVITSRPDGLAQLAANGNDCDSVGKILGRVDENGGEVLVQEQYNNGESGTTQAYTCVKVYTTLSDYRSSLSSTEPTRIVPLKTSADGNAIEKVIVRWFSKKNLGSSRAVFLESNENGVDFTSIKDASAPTPPVLSVQFYQMPEGGLSFGKNGGYDSDDVNTAMSNANATNRGLIWLVPVANNGGRTYNNIKNTNNALALSNNHTDGNQNNPYTVECANETTSNEFLCEATLTLPKAISADGTAGVGRQNNNAFLVLSIPYNQPLSDFQVTMVDKDGLAVDFVETQISIDSTGRANDLFSRVETRIEYADLYFPFPSHTLEMFSPNAEALSKNFWATHNCWYTNDNGEIKKCDGTDPDGGYSLNSGEL